MSALRHPSRSAPPDKRTLLACLSEDDIGRLFDELGSAGRRAVGSANWIAHSPFREDRHRSFTIRKADGVWHDKATGEGGSLFDAVMRIQHCSFKESLEWVFARCQSSLAVGSPSLPPPPGTSGGGDRPISAWAPIGRARPGTGTTRRRTLTPQPPLPVRGERGSEDGSGEVGVVQLPFPALPPHDGGGT